MLPLACSLACSLPHCILLMESVAIYPANARPHKRYQKITLPIAERPPLWTNHVWRKVICPTAGGQQCCPTLTLKETIICTRLAIENIVSREQCHLSIVQENIVIFSLLLYLPNRDLVVIVVACISTAHHEPCIDDLGHHFSLRSQCR